MHTGDYTLIRSTRKTVALMINEDGTVIVRAPNRMAKREIESFVRRHRLWIENHQRELAEARQKKKVLTEQERQQGIEDAKTRIPRRAAYYAGRMGVSYGRITIREQKTRWGSCSNKGNLNFNWKLALMPPEILDYVVVHELAHRREMNHSPRFWAEVEAILPDYRERRQKLREYGSRL